MSKQQKPPADPIDSAKAMLGRLGTTAANGSPRSEAELAMLQTVLIVRAIDRLTAAVKENTGTTRAIAMNRGDLRMPDDAA